MRGRPAPVGVRSDAPHNDAPHRYAALRARSISRSVWRQLQGRPFAARVLAVFERACALVTSEERLIALVLPQVGDGPLNVVVDGAPGDFATIEPGTPAWLEGSCLRGADLAVSLHGAVIWEARPDWEGLQAHREAAAGRLPLLRALALPQAPKGSLLALFSNPSRTAPAGSLDGSPGEGCEPPGAAYGDLPQAIFAKALAGAEALRAGWVGEPAQLRAGAVQLAGLGNGLTPAGDDFLTGVMLWGWLAHPAPQLLGRLLLEVAAPRTTVLSAAFLRAAAEGECSAPWHHLLVAMQSGEEGLIAATIQEVLAHGSTSGADTLAGFLWIDHQPKLE
jgi:hypothetical protein